MAAENRSARAVALIATPQLLPDKGVAGRLLRADPRVVRLSAPSRIRDLADAPQRRLWAPVPPTRALGLLTPRFTDLRWGSISGVVPVASAVGLLTSGWICGGSTDAGSNDPSVFLKGSSGSSRSRYRPPARHWAAPTVASAGQIFCRVVNEI